MRTYMYTSKRNCTHKDYIKYTCNQYCIQGKINPFSYKKTAPKESGLELNRYKEIWNAAKKAVET